MGGPGTWICSLGVSQNVIGNDVWGVCVCMCAWNKLFIRTQSMRGS